MPPRLTTTCVYCCRRSAGAERRSMRDENTTASRGAASERLIVTETGPVRTGKQEISSLRTTISWTLEQAATSSMESRSNHEQEKKRERQCRSATEPAWYRK